MLVVELNPIKQKAEFEIKREFSYYSVNLKANLEFAYYRFLRMFKEFSLVRDPRFQYYRRLRVMTSTS